MKYRTMRFIGGEENTTNFVLGEIALPGAVFPEKLYHPCRMNRGKALSPGPGKHRFNEYDDTVTGGC